MVGRRGSSFGLQIISVVIVLVLFVYGFHLYRTVSTQIEKVERDNADLMTEKEELSRDIQVLRDSKARLEQLLKSKEEQCSNNEKRLGQELEDKRNEATKERMDMQVKLESCTTNKETLEQELESMESKFSEVKERQNELKDENLMLKKEKQENINEVARLGDEVANSKKHLKEMVFYKEFYEKNSNSTQSKPTNKKALKEEDQNMQIVQPGDERKPYFKVKEGDQHGRSSNKTSSLKEDGNENGVIGQNAIDGEEAIDQVAPPKIEIKNKEKRDEEEEHKKGDPFELPVKKEDGLDDNKIKSPQEHDQGQVVKHSLDEPAVPDVLIPRAADEDDNKPDGKVHDLKGQGIPGDDDEDVDGAEKAHGFRGAPQGDKQVPDGANENSVNVDNRQQREP